MKGTGNQSRVRRWPVLLAVVCLGLVMLGGTSFVVVSALEEYDSFCISCHTAPEITYYNRAYIALDNPAHPSPDLSTAHYVEKSDPARTVPFKCITCHRGNASPGHRISAVTLGARDLLLWLAGRDNPTVEKQNTPYSWLANASCAGCHSKVLLTLDGINNHFHTYLPQTRDIFRQGGVLVTGEALRKNVGDAQIKELPATIEINLLCSGCHPPHRTAEAGFMDTGLRNAVCIQCHVTARKGPQNVQTLTGQ